MLDKRQVFGAFIGSLPERIAGNLPASFHPDFVAACRQQYSAHSKSYAEKDMRGLRVNGNAGAQVKIQAFDLLLPTVEVFHPESEREPTPN